MVVDTEQVDDAVDHEETVLAGDEVLHQSEEKVMLKLAVAGSRDGDVVVRHLRVDTEALGDLCDTFRTECAFGVWSYEDGSASVSSMATTASCREDLPMYATRPSAPPRSFGS